MPSVTWDRYKAVGANIVSGDEAWKGDLVMKIRIPTMEEAKKVEDRTLCSFI